MGTLIVAIKTVLPLFLVILTGLAFSKSKAASPAWIEILNKYALYIGFPALVLASLMHLEIGEQSYFKLILYNSIYIVSCFFAGFPIAKLLRLSRKMRQTLFMIIPFGNIAYLGMPVLQNAFGDEVLPIAAIISAVYIFWLLTLGIILVETTGEAEFRPKKLVLSLLSNPLLLSVFVGLFLISFEIKLPSVLAHTIQLFGNSVTAIVLFALGMFLGNQTIGKISEWSQVAAWTFVTMLLLPFLFYQFLNLLHFDAAFTKYSVIDAAMPLGLTPYVLSVQYNLETRLTARIVVLGTFLSIFIIPLWMVLLG